MQSQKGLHERIAELNEKAHDKKKVASEIIRFDDYFASPYGPNVACSNRGCSRDRETFCGYLADAFMATD